MIKGTPVLAVMQIWSQISTLARYHTTYASREDGGSSMGVYDGWALAVVNWIAFTQSRCSRLQ